MVGGEEQWDRIVSAHGSPGSPVVMLNSAYSTSYDSAIREDLKRRITSSVLARVGYSDLSLVLGAYLEKPDGTVELLQQYRTKPALREVAAWLRRILLSDTPSTMIVGLQDLVRGCKPSTGMLCPRSITNRSNRRRRFGGGDASAKNNDIHTRQKHS